jgi:predicted DCC family thiol-disulfide oxidoreductase YuxK
MVLLDADGHLLTRSTAFLRVLHSLGGAWRVLAAIIGLVPAVIRDAAYDLVARTRRRLFSAPAQACPILPPPLRSRFAA